MSENKYQNRNTPLQVILVDEYDNAIGSCEKLAAHERGLLHRAFSIFIFNDKGEMLLQKRADDKYHSQGLWTNACCSHPSPSQSTLDSAQIRLKMEMGFNCSLKIVDHLLYKHDFKNGLTENEYDHIIVGYYSGEVKLNPFEASSCKWLSLHEIEQAIKSSSGQFTYWFKLALPKVKCYIDGQKQNV